VGNILSLGRQSGRIKGDAESRRRRLEELRAAVLAHRGLSDWALRDARVRALLDGCAEGMRQVNPAPNPVPVPVAVPA